MRLAVNYLRQYTVTLVWGRYPLILVQVFYSGGALVSLIVLVDYVWNLLTLGRVENWMEALAMDEWLWTERHACIGGVLVAQGAVGVVVSLEVAIAEAAEEGWLIPNLEDLLNILELEATFPHIVLRV